MLDAMRVLFGREPTLNLVNFVFTTHLFLLRIVSKKPRRVLWIYIGHIDTLFNTPTVIVQGEFGTGSVSWLPFLPHFHSSNTSSA